MQKNQQLLELSAQLGESLKARGLTLALAESCTGGLASGAITEIAGSSAWFDCGFVTYSNQAKMGILKVLSSSLETHGAVSEQIAAEMAQGCLQASHAQIAASITGIAGPDGGTEKNLLAPCVLALRLPTKHKLAHNFLAASAMPCDINRLYLR